MLRKSMVFITLLLALFFTACNSINIQKEENLSKTNTSLENTYWKAVSLYDKEVEVVKDEAHIKFDKNGSLNGSLGCNNFFGNFQTDENSIVFKRLASTKMMCQNMQVEDSFLKVLQNTKKYKIKGETLSFFDEKNNEISTFKAVYF